MNATRRLAMGVLGLALCLGLVSGMKGLADDKPDAAPASQMDQLRQRVKQLEARVARLEQRQATMVIPAPQAPRQVPKSWVPKEFNGMQYYIVPVEGGGRPVVKPNR